MIEYYDIKPYSEVATISSERTASTFALKDVLPVVGMSESFAKKVIGKHSVLTEDMVITLLEQDAFSETFVPRSKVLSYLRNLKSRESIIINPALVNSGLTVGEALGLIDQLPNASIQCVVTSTPYWAMRIYDELFEQIWADGEQCSFGLEQTPEAFIRHSVEVLYHLQSKLTDTGSIWWNIMDSYNTRTQIRGNATEALTAMKGLDKRSWKDHKYKRYSAGHSYLKDGEQCLIPQRIAERASRIGYYLKSTISWCKTASLPEPQTSRVSRNTEYILHLSKTRAPTFYKEQYLQLSSSLGGKQPLESEKLSDFWYLPTSAGRDGHGAQFPLQLPCRCIALSSDKKDIVLDPFIGVGTTAIAAKLLDRQYVGFDICSDYVRIAQEKLETAIIR